MSMELYVACPSGAFPRPEEISAIAVSNGIALQVQSLDWTTQSGFLPMTISGRDSGVEVDVFHGDEANEITAGFGLAGQLAIVVMRWSSDMTECAIACAFAGAVATLSKGQILDPEQGTVVEPHAMFDEAKLALSQTA